MERRGEARRAVFLHRLGYFPAAPELPVPDCEPEAGALERSAVPDGALVPPVPVFDPLVALPEPVPPLDPLEPLLLPWSQAATPAMSSAAAVKGSHRRMSIVPELWRGPSETGAPSRRSGGPIFLTSGHSTIAAARWNYFESGL